MNLSHLWMLNLLWLLPLAVVALIVQGRKKKRALQVFADPHLLDRLTALDHRGRRFIKALLLLLSLGLMLFALAGPRWGSHYEEVSQKGVDIMLLIDVSPSMLVEDIPPNRLERARREILDFIKVVSGDRVGLIAFAGAAFIQCPLTLDYAALEMFLSALQPDLIPVPGTDLGAAIDLGISAFDEKSATDKVILLITDGEDNETRGIKAARQAAAKGVKIFVFGIGDVGGGPIPELDGSGGFKKDRQGQLILSKLEEEGLQEIASLTGGTYVRSVAGDLDLDILYFDGIKSHTQAQELKSGKIKVYEERFPLFVLAAFILLLIEGFIDEKIRLKADFGRKVPLARAGLLFLTIMAICTLTAARSQAVESPDELYRKGRFAEAEKAYARSDMDNPKDLRYRYNRGCAAYQSGDYQAAAAASPASCDAVKTMIFVSTQLITWAMRLISRVIFNRRSSITNRQLRKTPPTPTHATTWSWPSGPCKSKRSRKASNPRTNRSRVPNRSKTHPMVKMIRRIRAGSLMINLPSRISKKKTSQRNRRATSNNRLSSHLKINLVRTGNPSKNLNRNWREI